MVIKTMESNMLSIKRQARHESQRVANELEARKDAERKREKLNHIKMSSEEMQLNVSNLSQPNEFQELRMSASDDAINKTKTVCSALEQELVEDRINSTENHISELCSQFGTYMKNVAHMRDSGDELAKAVHNFASEEVLNHSLRVALAQFSDILCALEDYRETEVQRLHHKVILELLSYNHICKQAKEELKKNIIAITKSESKRKNLEKMKEKSPSKTLQIKQAEREINKSGTEAAMASSKLARLIDIFETKKLEDIKRIFLEFVRIELLFHTKAVELYSEAYCAVDEIKVDEDAQAFCSQLRLSSFGSSAETIHPGVDNKCSTHEDPSKTSEVSALKAYMARMVNYGETVPKSHCPLTSPCIQKLGADGSTKFYRSSSSDGGGDSSVCHLQERNELCRSFKWTY